MPAGSIPSLNPFERIALTVRAIRSALWRSHVRSDAFLKFQNGLSVHTVIQADVPTRFHSTVDMFSSALANKDILRRFQDQGRRDPDFWPASLHLSTDDFDVIQHVADVFKPGRSATLELSAEISFLCDVIPTIKSTIDTVRRTEVSSSAVLLREALIATLSSRLKMLFGTESDLPFPGGRQLSSVSANESIISAYLS